MTPKQHSRQMVYTSRYGKPTKIIVWNNKEFFSTGHEVTLHPKCMKSWNAILSYLTIALQPRFGAVRKLYHLGTKKLVCCLEEIKPNEKYVAVGTEVVKFKKRGYLSEKDRKKLRTKRPSKRTDPIEIVSTTFDNFMEYTKMKNRRVVYFMVSGRACQIPLKIVFIERDLLDYNMILEYLGYRLDISEGVQYICDVTGKKISDASELKHGELYITVPFGLRFIKLNYLQLFAELLPSKTVEVNTKKDVKRTQVEKKSRKMSKNTSFVRDSSIKCTSSECKRNNCREDEIHATWEQMYECIDTVRNILDSIITEVLWRSEHKVPIDEFHKIAGQKEEDTGAVRRTLSRASSVIGRRRTESEVPTDEFHKIGGQSAEDTDAVQRTLSRASSVTVRRRTESEVPTRKRGESVSRTQYNRVSTGGSNKIEEQTEEPIDAVKSFLDQIINEVVKRTEYSEIPDDSTTRESSTIVEPQQESLQRNLTSFVDIARGRGSEYNSGKICPHCLSQNKPAAAADAATGSSCDSQMIKKSVSFLRNTVPTNTFEVQEAKSSKINDFQDRTYDSLSGFSVPKITKNSVIQTLSGAIGTLATSNSLGMSQSTSTISVCYSAKKLSLISSVPGKARSLGEVEENTDFANRSFTTRGIQKDWKKDEDITDKSVQAYSTIPEIINVPRILPSLSSHTNGQGLMKDLHESFSTSIMPKMSRTIQANVQSQQKCRREDAPGFACSDICIR